MFPWIVAIPQAAPILSKNIKEQKSQPSGNGAVAIESRLTSGPGMVTLGLLSFWLLYLTDLVPLIDAYSIL